MNKKITVILLSLSILFFNIDYVSAATITIPYFGTTSETNYLWSNTANGRHVFEQINYVSHSNNAEMLFYRLVDGSASYMSSRTLSSGQGQITPPENTNAIRLRSNDGREVYLTYAKSNNPLSRHVYFETGGDDGGGGNDGGGGGGDCGCIVNIPGWGHHMAKLDEILAAIPSPPNWQNVANIFNNTIVPNLISQTSDMLGYAPSPPSPPRNRPKLTGDVPSPPKGNNAPGLTDSGFSANDLKNQAEKIEFREDPTGGFTILDPIGSLPSQEEFKDNIPKEPEMIPPEVPTTEAEAPSAPEEQENIAPSPPEVEAQLPSEPTDNESAAPFPSEQEGTAPSPGEIINPLPGAPVENDNFAPSPGLGEGTTAPMPGNNDFNAPIPGSGNHQAPLPGENNKNAPIPKESGKAPIPEGG